MAEGFRISLFGFNKADVTKFSKELSMGYAQKLREKDEEITRLSKRLDELKEKIAALSDEIEALEEKGNHIDADE